LPQECGGIVGVSSGKPQYGRSGRSGSHSEPSSPPADAITGAAIVDHGETPFVATAPARPSVVPESFRQHRTNVNGLKNLMAFTGLSCVASLMLLGGVGRLISLVSNGRPHWLQEALTAIEIVVPATFFRIADAEEKAELQVAG
jgi:hypothetical protein